MIEITVGKDCDFITVTDALNAIPYRQAAVVRIAEGVYHEKIFFEKKDITLIGAGAGKTVITWSDGAKANHPDGAKFGTFRSYTAFMGGERVQVENLTFANAVGDGRIGGQGLAAYVEADIAAFHNVDFIGYLDTLFCAPLPESPSAGWSFRSTPRGHSKRIKTKQYYENCRIEGDVDFIFGGADAVFDCCKIVSRNRNSNPNGYITAPSGYQGDLGFVFRDCRFTSSGGCADATVFLGRPWRPEGKSTLLKCYLGEHIHSEGWDSWGTPEENIKAGFYEYQCYGPGSDASGRVSWSKTLNDTEARIINDLVNTHIVDCNAK